ncbi:hypothetical protein BW721_04900 [Jeotgalibaca sp. PTS2502]|nr:hypothetical protein BW721_04900 [Jeotgalibaca sp. PTS2502]
MLKRKVGCIIILVALIVSVTLIDKSEDGIFIVSKQDIPQSIEVIRHYSEGETVLYKHPTIIMDSEKIASDTNSGESKISLTIGQQTEDIISYVDSNVNRFNIKIKVVSYDELTGEISIRLSYRDGLEKISKPMTFK